MTIAMRRATMIAPKIHKPVRSALRNVEYMALNYTLRDKDCAKLPIPDFRLDTTHPDRIDLFSESEKKMKTKYSWLLAIIVMLCLLGFNIHGQKQSSGRTNWEYKSVFSTSASLEYVLNDLGAQGWELIAIDVNSSDKNGLKGTKYYLKRAR